MTRHGKNCTAGSVYTYHERKKDSTQSGYGSKQSRLGKDSIKDFDCCSLTLQPCQNPVVTPDGHLYDKEAILTYIIQQKQKIARRLKEYEKQKNKDAKEAAELYAAEKESQKKNFVEKERSIISKPIDAFASKSTAGPSTEASVSNMANGKEKQLPSFWLPTMTPDNKPTTVKKPDEKVRCPMSGKILKMKDLIDVKFKEIQDKDDKRSLIVKDARYVCACTNDVLGNSVPCVVLRTSGSVVTADFYEKIIKEDMLDPINGKKMTDKDIIPLQRGASGFSGKGVSLHAKKHGASLTA